MNTVSTTYLRSCLVAVALGVTALSATAQNDNSENLTNAALEAAATIVSNVMAQASDYWSTNDAASNGVAQAEQSYEGTNAPGDTNALSPGTGNVQPGPSESRRQWLLRQRAGAPDTNEPGGARGGALTNVALASRFRPPKPEYPSFKLITERNIFNPNRSPQRSRGAPGPRPKIAESFALVGMMSYDKGTFAFFDGSSSEYRKAVKLADTIAGYQVTDINGNTIKLAAGTNQVELHVGMQMRREEGGGWVASAQSETYVADSNSTAATKADSAASGAENDVLERLRKRRDSE